MEAIGKFPMLSIMLFWMVFISANLAAVNSRPTCEEYRDKICTQGTFKCPPYATCCQKNSQMCSSLSRTCEDVFLPGEDSSYVCCSALSLNGTTREGLVEACIYRLGSETWPEYCKAKYPGESQDEQSSTVAESNPPPMLVPTQQQKEQQIPSSEPSSVKVEDCVWQSMLGVAATLIVCVVFANKTLWAREKCQQILCFLFGECQACSLCQHGGTHFIEINPPADEPESPTNLPAFGNEPNPLNLNRRELTVAPKIGAGDTAPETARTDETRMNGDDRVLHRGLVLEQPDYRSEENEKILNQNIEL